MSELNATKLIWKENLDNAYPEMIGASGKTVKIFKISEE